MITGILTTIALNGILLSAGALAPPGEPQGPGEQAFQKGDQDRNGTIDRDEFRQFLRRAVSRQMNADPGRKDAGSREDRGRPRRESGQAWSARQVPEGRDMPRPDPELRMRRALERAMTQTLRRHRSELDQMFREAVEQALQEMGPPPAMDRQGDRPGQFERRINPGPGERRRAQESSDEGMGRRQGRGERPDGFRGMCPCCRMMDRLHADGPRDGKRQGDLGPKRDRQMQRADKKAERCSPAGECRDQPKRPRKLDRDRDSKIDHKDMKDAPRERREKKDRRQADPPDESDD